METKETRSKHKSVLKWLLISLLSILLIVIVILVILYIIACSLGYLYVILIDAGSTSSKISIFKWKDLPFHENGFVTEVHRLKVEPGLSEYKDNATEAFKQLHSHLRKLTVSHVPPNSRIFLAATAGMRMVMLDNPLKSEAILEDLKLQLPRSGFSVLNPHSDVRILSGRDEGIYAWISVNYLAKRLGTIDTPPLDEDKMVGALDLGGASSQIAFSPKSKKPEPHTSLHRLFGQDFNVYSYSHLCYGKTVALLRAWAEVIGDRCDAVIENPCLLKNYQLKVNTSEIFTKPCVTSQYAVDLVGSERHPNPKLPQEITFRGTGDPLQCRSIVQKLFPERTCERGPCMFHGVYRPPLRGKFTAFSGYSFVIRHFKFSTGGQNLTRHQVKTAVDVFCQWDWENVASKHRSVDLPFIATYCFDGVYIDALLANYGFNSSDSWRDIEFASKVADTTISWALGYAIDATGMIDSKSPQIHLTFSAFLSTIIILGVLLIALIVGIVALHHRK